MPTVQYLEAPVGALRPNPFNPNRVSAENERKIRRSIERNGLFKPIIVRQVAGQEGYEIIGGQHRWEQAVELGHKTIPIANLGEITDAQAKEICVIDNAQYGSDDTLTLSELLKDIGTDDIQDFLPYGDTDIAAIFSATSIDLDALVMPQEVEVSDENPPENDAPSAKPAKTHTVMRFKLANADAERLTALIAKTQNAQDFKHEDALTNAGDALVFLLAPAATTAPAAGTPENWDDMLDAIKKAQEEEGQ